MVIYVTMEPRIMVAPGVAAATPNDSCNSGYALDGDNCRLWYNYACSNGTPKDDADDYGTWDNVTTKCKSCNSGYALDGNKCRLIYNHICANGTPSSGINWDHELTRCAYCNSDYFVVWNHECRRRVDLLQFGSNAPTHNF